MVFGNYKRLVMLAQIEDAGLKAKAEEIAQRLGLAFEYRVTGYGELAQFMAEAAATRDLKKRSEEHTSELQSLRHLVCRLLLENKSRGRRHGNHAGAKTPVRGRLVPVALEPEGELASASAISGAAEHRIAHVVDSASYLARQRA